MRGGLIAEVGVGLAPSPGVRVVDGSGGTLLPGLIDSHVHPMRVGNLAEALVVGVTTEAGHVLRPPTADSADDSESGGPRTQVDPAQTPLIHEGR